MEHTGQTIQTPPLPSAPPSSERETASASLATWPGAATISKSERDDWEERRAVEREEIELEREERLLACEEAFKLRDMIYSPNRSELERRLDAQAAVLCLSDVPPGAI